MINIIKKKLNNTLSPLILEIYDKSHLHAKHNHLAKKGNTHIKIFIVADIFEEKNLLQRHRLINDIIKDEFAKLHSVEIKALTKKEFRKEKII